jgi:hypothetical protein
MKTFRERFNELYNDFLSKGYDAFAASETSITKIVYENRMGITYSTM